MMFIWFWTFLFAAPFGLSAYQQASEPGWKLGLVAATIAAIGLCYIQFGLPEELWRYGAEFGSHPDRLKFMTAGWIVVAAIVCLAGIFVGRALRSRVRPAKLGVWAFLFAFIGMNVFATFIITGAFT